MDEWQALLDTLHSNLVIFKFDQRFTSQLHYHDLYIPIWLYSNPVLVSPLRSVYKLYIPIWLYSNKAARTNKMFFNFFTFQSGYIQIY